MPICIAIFPRLRLFVAFFLCFFDDCVVFDYLHSSSYQHILSQGVLIVFLNHIQHCLAIYAVAFAVFDNLCIQIFIGDNQIFSLCDCFQHQSCINALHGCILEGFSHGFFICTHVLIVNIHGQTLTNDIFFKFSHHAVNLVIVHNLRHFHLAVCNCCIQQLIALQLLCLFCLLCSQFSQNVCFVFIQSGEFGNIFCKCVIQFGQFLCCDTVYLNCEYSCLACQFGCMVSFGEGYVDIKFFADVVANNLILKAFDEGMRAQLQIKAFCLAAIESNAVNGAQIVNVYNIAQLCCLLQPFLRSASAPFPVPS